MSDVPAKSGGTRPPFDGIEFIPDDDILITDVGIGKRSEAFRWLMIGHNIYDSQYHEITVRDLEYGIDPHGVQNPMYVRGALWKTVPQHYWLARRGGKNGPEPAQPGLNPQISGMLRYSLENDWADKIAEYYGRRSTEYRRFDSLQTHRTRGELNQTTPPTRSEILDSNSSIRSWHKLSGRSRSIAPLSVETLNPFSPSHRRASSVSIDSVHTPSNTFSLSGDMRIVWSGKEITRIDQSREDTDGFVCRSVGREKAGARPDPVFDAYSNWSDGNMSLQKSDWSDIDILGFEEEGRIPVT